MVVLRYNEVDLLLYTEINNKTLRLCEIKEGKQLDIIAQLDLPINLPENLTCMLHSEQNRHKVILGTSHGQVFSINLAELMHEIGGD